jgi:hypothetical protein
MDLNKCQSIKCTKLKRGMEEEFILEIILKILEFFWKFLKFLVMEIFLETRINQGKISCTNLQ